MITIIAKFKVNNAHTEEFKRCALDVTRQTKREKGCLSYTVFQNRSGSSEFTFVEEWLNDTAIEQHNAAPHFKAFMDKIAPMLDESASIEQLTKIPSVYF